MWQALCKRALIVVLCLLVTPSLAQAQAANADGTGIIQNLPLLIIGIPFAVVSFLIAKRKGKSPVKFAILSLIPFIGLAFLVYLIGHSDKDVYDRLDRIEALLKARQTPEADEQVVK